MIKRMLLAISGVLALASIALCQTNPTPAPAPPVTRTASGQVLTSKDTPAVRLKFDKAFKYVGGHSFVLYDVANAEQHFFVDADKDGRIKRFYWIQFEGYLPTNTHSYNYKSPKIVNIGGFDFFADAYARSLKGYLGPPDSDGNRARAFLAGKGFKMAGTEFLSQRLVHIVDAAKRNELMIIYVEDLSTGVTGVAGVANLTAANLAEGGSARDRWPEIAQGLLERAQKNMKVSSGRAFLSIQEFSRRRRVKALKARNSIAHGQSSATLWIQWITDFSARPRWSRVAPLIYGNNVRSQSRSIFQLGQRRHYRSFDKHHYHFPRK